MSISSKAVKAHKPNRNPQSVERLNRLQSHQLTSFQQTSCVNLMRNAVEQSVQVKYSQVYILYKIQSHDSFAECYRWARLL